MILKEEYISCFQCNWDNKPDNIQKIAYTLNIGIDSMIFVDDSKFEIEAVKSMLPNIEAFQYDCNTIYEQFSCFNLNSKNDLTNIKKRTETYRTNIQREKLKSDFISSDEYLMLLHTKIDIHKSLPIEMTRISELTQRTNKFTNGIRYTVNFN